MTDNNIIGRRYALLFDTDDLVAIATPAMVIKSVNRAYCTFFDRQEHQLTGSLLTDGYCEDVAESCAEPVPEMTPEEPVVHFTRRSGTGAGIRWVKWKQSGIYDEHGTLLEIMVVGRDVDEYISIKKQKDEVASLLKAYRYAIDTNIICSITDKKGIITYVNRNFCRVSQYSVGELIGHSHNVVNSGYHRTEFFSELWQSISSGRMWQGEIRNRAKDGSIYWVKTVIIPIMDDARQITSYLSLRSVITEQKMLEEEKKVYLQSLEDMLYMVSHELRNPITKCMGILNIMTTTMSPDNEYQALLDCMVDATLQMDGYSKRLNDYLLSNKGVSARVLDT